jgi:hypothetical protein
MQGAAAAGLIARAANRRRGKDKSEPPALSATQQNTVY